MFGFNWSVPKWRRRRGKWVAENVSSGYSMSFDVLKYDSLPAYIADQPYDTFHGKKNVLTPAGRMMIWKLVAGLGAATDFYSTVNSYIFVGDSSLASPTTSGQPFDLFGANAVGVAVDPTSPTILAAADGQTVTITYSATFDVNTGNFLWKEAGLVNGSAVSGAPNLAVLPGTGTMLNRYVPSNGLIGTKTNGLIWVAQMNLILGPTGD